MKNMKIFSATCNKGYCDFTSKLKKPKPPMCTGYCDNFLKIPI